MNGPPGQINQARWVTSARRRGDGSPGTGSVNAARLIVTGARIRPGLTARTHAAHTPHIDTRCLLSLPWVYAHRTQTGDRGADPTGCSARRISKCGGICRARRRDAPRAGRMAIGNAIGDSGRDCGGLCFRPAWGLGRRATSAHKHGRAEAEVAGPIAQSDLIPGDGRLNSGHCCYDRLDELHRQCWGSERLRSANRRAVFAGQDYPLRFVRQRRRHAR